MADVFTSKGKCGLVTLFHVSVCQLVLMLEWFPSQEGGLPAFCHDPPPHPPIPGKVGGNGCGQAGDNSCPPATGGLEESFNKVSDSRIIVEGTTHI